MPTNALAKAYPFLTPRFAPPQGGTKSEKKKTIAKGKLISRFVGRWNGTVEGPQNDPKHAYRPFRLLPPTKTRGHNTPGAIPLFAAELRRASTIDNLFPFFSRTGKVFTPSFSICKKDRWGSDGSAAANLPHRQQPASL